MTSQQSLTLNNQEQRFLNLIVINEDALSIDDMQKKLGVSRSTVYRYRKRLGDTIAAEAQDLAKGKAIKMIGNLDTNASNGDTGAAVKILEIGGVYVPKQINAGQGSVNLGLVILPIREALPGKPVEVEIVENLQDQ